MTIATFCLLREDIVRLEAETAYWNFMRLLVLASYRWHRVHPIGVD